MNLAVPHSFDVHTVFRWSPLFFTLPFLLAAGLSEPTQQGSLPDAGAYRTPLSDSLIESTKWREPQNPEQTWRAAPPPSLHWRTPAPPQKSSSSKRTIELFPKYRPGNPTDFDYTTREEKPQIKVFEFGGR